MRIGCRGGPMRPTRGAVLGLLVAALPAAAAGDLELSPTDTTDEAAFARVAPDLARRVIARYGEAEGYQALDDLSRLQVVAGDYPKALQTLRALRDLRRAADPILADGILVQSEIYARARRRQSTAGVPFASAYPQDFRETFRQLDDKAAYYVGSYLPHEPYLNRTRNDLRRALKSRAEQQTVGMVEAVDLLRKYQLYEASLATQPLIGPLLAEDDQRRYVIDDAVMIPTPDGATLSAMVFRSKTGASPGPAALFFNIYP